MASVGSILSGAFSPFKEQPVTVAIWAAIFIAYTVGVSALTIGGVLVDLEAFRTGTISPAAAIGLGVLMFAAALIFMAMMSCAVYRAVLRPDEGGFASIRLGADEFRMAGLYLIMIIAGLFLGLVLGLGAFFLMGGAALASGGGGGAFGFAMLVALVCVVAGIYVAVRLSLIFPMTFVRRQISIDEGWGLSRGHFWTLFLAYLVIWIILIVLQMILPGVPGQPDFFSSLRALQDPQAMQALEAQQVTAATSISLMTMLPYLLITSVVQVFSHVVTNAASATAVREFLRDDGEVLDDDIEATAQIFE